MEGHAPKKFDRYSYTGRRRGLARVSLTISSLISLTLFICVITTSTPQAPHRITRFLNATFSAFFSFLFLCLSLSAFELDSRCYGRTCTKGWRRRRRPSAAPHLHPLTHMPPRLAHTPVYISQPSAPPPPHILPQLARAHNYFWVVIVLLDSWDNLPTLFLSPYDCIFLLFLSVIYTRSAPLR